MFGAFALIFLLCELGQQIIDRSDETYDELLRCNWYTFPLTIQKILPLIMIGAQQSMTMKGFGNIIFTRETLTDVSHSNTLI